MLFNDIIFVETLACASDYSHFRRYLYTTINVESPRMEVDRDIQMPIVIRRDFSSPSIM